VTEVFPDFAVLEGIGQITIPSQYACTRKKKRDIEDLPDNTASRSEKTFCPVGILLDCAEELEDRIEEGDKQVALVACLHGVDGAIPSVENAFPQRRDVVDHLVVVLGGQGDLTSLLEYLCHNGQVSLESAADSMCDITEALQNRGLQLVTESGALRIRLAWLEKILIGGDLLGGC
jgi:hypothetical protein